MIELSTYGPQWEGFEATVFDWHVVVHDYRTRPTPFAMIVDAIAMDKRNDRHVKPSREEAVRSIGRAHEFMVHAMANKDPMSAAHIVVHLLFAIRALKKVSPVVFMVGVRNLGNFSGLLNLATQQTDETEMVMKIVEALMQLGEVLPNDDNVDKRLNRERSQAWSADIPGIIMFVDVWDRAEMAPPPGDEGDPKPMERLVWSSGADAKEAGTDLPTVAAGLPEAELDFWIAKFETLPLYHELAVLRAERARRSESVDDIQSKETPCSP